MLRPSLFSLFLSLCLLLTAPAAVMAQGDSRFNSPRDPDYAGEQDKVWREDELALPAPPVVEAMLALPGRDLDPGYDYFIDPASLSVGSDEVVRYTIVIAPRSGPRHVIFEGLRCLPESVRVLAVGMAEGFRPREGEPWRAIPSKGPFAYRKFLHEVAACDHTGHPRPAEEILRRITRPQVLTPNEDRVPFFYGRGS